MLASEFEAEQKKVNSAESWLGTPTPALPKIDWAKHKSRIADPAMIMYHHHAESSAS